MVHFLHLLIVKLYCCLKRPEVNKKEAEDGAFLDEKKHLRKLFLSLLESFSLTKSVASLHYKIFNVPRIG